MPEFPLPLKQGYCRDTTYVKVLSRESCPASNVTMRGGPGCQQQLSPGMNIQRIPAGFYLTKRTSQFPASRDPRYFLTEAAISAGTRACMVPVAPVDQSGDRARRGRIVMCRHPAGNVRYCRIQSALGCRGHWSFWPGTIRRLAQHCRSGRGPYADRRQPDDHAKPSRLAGAWWRECLPGQRRIGQPWQAATGAALVIAVTVATGLRVGVCGCR